MISARGGWLTEHCNVRSLNSVQYFKSECVYVYEVCIIQCLLPKHVLIMYAVCWVSTAMSWVSPMVKSLPLSLAVRSHTHRGGSTVAKGGQNPAAFSYLWPIKSNVIWWLTLMGNGWNPSLSSSLIVSTLNGATVKIRWCHHVRSPPSTLDFTVSTYTLCGFLKKESLIYPFFLLSFY